MLKVPGALNRYDDILLLGLFGDNFFTKAKDFVKRGLGSISKIEPVRQLVAMAMPKLAKIVASAVPGMGAFGDEIEKILQGKAQQILEGMKDWDANEEIKLEGLKHTNISNHSVNSSMSEIAPMIS